MRTKILTSLTLSALLAWSQAYAVPVTVDMSDDPNFNVEPAVVVDTLLPIDFEDITAGEFRGVIDEGTGPQAFLAYCLELEELLNTDSITMEKVLSDGTQSFSAAGLTQLNMLYTNFYDLAFVDASDSAAFQLLVWEIRYDGGGTLDLLSGNFQVDAAADYVGDADALDAATDWVTAINDGGLDTDPTMQFFELQFVGDGIVEAQDLLIRNPLDTPSETPLPGTLALLGIGLGLLARKRLHR